jgi:hypothetical protein
MSLEISSKLLATYYRQDKEPKMWGDVFVFSGYLGETIKRAAKEISGGTNNITAEDTLLSEHLLFAELGSFFLKSWGYPFIRSDLDPCCALSLAVHLGWVLYQCQVIAGDYPAAHQQGSREEVREEFASIVGAVKKYGLAIKGVDVRSFLMAGHIDEEGDIGQDMDTTFAKLEEIVKLALNPSGRQRTKRPYPLAN